MKFVKILALCLFSINANAAADGSTGMGDPADEPRKIRASLPKSGTGPHLRERISGPKHRDRPSTILSGRLKISEKWEILKHTYGDVEWAIRGLYQKEGETEKKSPPYT